MHIPDGYLSPPVWAALDVAAIGVVAYSARAVKKRLGDEHIPALAVLGAFIFAAQMVQFPVAGGTSGHFMGGALAAILLGPRAAMLVMAVVVALQCLLFRDGGIMVLGANIFNMGIIGALVGHGVYRAITRLIGERARPAAAFLAGWCSLMLGALATALQLVMSGVASAIVVLPAMLGVHAVIGIGEGLITAAALAAIASIRPELVRMERV